MPEPKTEAEDRDRRRMPKTLGPVRCLAGWLVVGWLAGVRLVGGWLAAGVWLAAIRQAEETGRLDRVPSYAKMDLLCAVLAVVCLVSIISRQ